MYNLTPFKFWCQKVLPLVYDDSLSYYEVLAKVVDYMNKVMENNMEIMQAIEDIAGDTIPISDYVTPDMFGAVGDGLADDTEALQKAIDSGKNVCLLMDKIYLVTNTIHLKAISPSSISENGRQRVSRTIFAKAYTDYSNPNSNISCKIANPDFPVFAIDSGRWTMQNIYVNCENQATGNQDITFIKTNMEGVDVDFNMLDCRIANGKLLADFTGRGFLLRDSIIIGFQQLIDIKWKTENTDIYHNDTTGQRAIRILGNRFHSVNATNPFITLTSGNAYGLQFIDNEFDRGFSNLLLCKTAPYNWMIANNNITGMREANEALMRFQAGANNIMITNNHIAQPMEPVSGGNIKFRYFIRFDADTEVVGAVIANNMVDEIPNGALVYLPKSESDTNSARLKGCVISNNMVDLFSNMTVEGGIVRAVQPTLERCVISGNAINRVTTSNSKGCYALYSSGSATLNDCKIMANVTPDTEHTFGKPAGSSLNMTRTIIDDFLMSAAQPNEPEEQLEGEGDAGRE